MKVGDMVLSKNKPSRIESFVGWQIRHDVDIIVNTDGLVIQPTREAAGGGILSNPNGIPLRAFAANYGICTITRAELRAALYGIQIAWEQDYKKVNLQIDSAAVISLIYST
ncbi:Putative ribonuclease H protein At1g65750 [Linum grandiflorum]